MNIVERELRMLLLENGRCPFEEWYEGLRDLNARQRIRARLVRVRAGNLGDCRAVGDGVMELRLDFGPGYRVYFAQVGQRIILLLVGGDKSSQQRDIATAKELWEQNADADERFQRDFPE